MYRINRRVVWATCGGLPSIAASTLKRPRPRGDDETARRLIVTYRDSELEDRLADEVASLD